MCVIMLYQNIPIINSSHKLKKSHQVQPTNKYKGQSSPSQTISHPLILYNFQMMFQTSFQDYSPAVFIRNLAQTTILPFADPSQTFRSQELRLLLTSVFKYREYEVSYELMKVLCFGKNKYISITVEELTDYLLEKYLGENTVNNYAYQKGYARREEKIMNKVEFIETLALGLTHFQGFNMAEFLVQFQNIFDQLDQQKRGVITQNLYSQFLKYYFGSESPMVVNPTKRVTQISESEELIPETVKQDSVDRSVQSPIKQTSSHNIEPNKYYLSNKQITAQSFSNRSIKISSALQEFHDLIVDQITAKCSQYDENKDGFLTKKDSQKFLYEVLQLEYHSIDFIINSYFNFNRNGQVSYSELVQIVCEVHFREIISNIIKNQQKIDTPSKIHLQKDYFIHKVLENCYFFNSKPSQSLLQKVYEELLAKSQYSYTSLITLEDFRAFILVHCCNNKLIFRSNTKKSTNTLTIPPQSIMEVENSNYQEDESASEQLRISRKEFDSAQKNSSSKENGNISRQSLEGQIGLSSNKQTKRNKLSEQSINMQNQLLVADIPIVLSGKQININAVKEEQPITLVAPHEQILGQIKNVINEQQMQDKPFKQLLWSVLDNSLLKYAKNSEIMIDQKECEEFIDSEELFQENREATKAKICRLFIKQAFISFQQLIGLIIHMRGEEALLKFNKSQIKGKSTINQQEISDILFQAFGKLRLKKDVFSNFSKLLLAQNGKNLLTYKNYLELIARNLSIKNNF